MANDHEQQLQFASETPRCSARLWRLWRNLVPSDRELDMTLRQSDRSRYIPPLRRLLYHASYSYDVSCCICLLMLRRHAFFTLRPECGDVYAPWEWHICYTLGRGRKLCSSRLHNAWRCLCLSSAYGHMPHFHFCLALRFCHLLQYSFRFRYIAGGCICFAIIVFYMSEICCAIFPFSSSMHSVLHILSWSIIGLRWLFLLVSTRIVTLIPVKITYYALSSLHSALIHHRLAMHLPPHPHPHPHRRHPFPHTRQHH